MRDNVFSKSVGKQFYRYIRPVKFDEKRYEFITLPRGGICLRLDPVDSVRLSFAYSRCHPEDHFNRTVAKFIADGRAMANASDPRLLALTAGIPNLHDPTELCNAIIRHVRTWKPADEPRIIEVYLKNEWAGFADALERIVVHNEKEKEKARIWLLAAGAMEMAEAYKEKSHA